MGSQNPSKSFRIAQEEFEEAWRAPAHTRFVLPAVDVNKTLKKRYRVVPERSVSRSEIWDMELKKAWDPLTYIPYVVSEGGSWGREKLGDGSEYWSRASQQAGWITKRHGLVLEDVHIDPDAGTILFMGRAHMKRQDGSMLRADDHQPLFHVEHGVGGTDLNPENLWRIVLLTENEDRRFHEPFLAMAKAGWLPGFIEIYLQRDLGMSVTRR